MPNFRASIALKAAAAKQVWFYRDTRAPTTNLHIVLNTRPPPPQKNPFLTRATQKKNTCQSFPPKTIPESKISNPKKSFDHPRHLNSEYPLVRAPPLWDSWDLASLCHRALGQLGIGLLEREDLGDEEAHQ